MAIDPATLREDLTMRFEDTVAWRRDKAEQYPHDRQRNLDAAAMLERLAASAAAIDERTMQELARLDEGVDATYRYLEAEDEALRLVGFRSAPESAPAFAQRLIGRLADR